MIDRLQKSVSDLCLGFARVDLWTSLAFAEIRRRYRRTLIGPFWTTLSVGAFIGMLTLIWSAVWDREMSEFIAYLSAGLIVWYYISQTLNEACDFLAAEEKIITELNIGISIFIISGIFRNIIVFLHNFLIFIFITVFFLHWPSSISLIAVATFALVTVFLTGTGLALAILCARFRDVGQLVRTVTSIMFLTTPIFWYPEAIASRRPYIVTLNPFHHLIDIVRAPLLNQWPSTTSIIVVCVLSVLAWIAGILMLARFRSRVAYWL
jgi:ABC-type polysaccharide/polyol phosphate export permease